MIYYNRNNKAINVTIEGVSNYTLQGLTMSSNDISDNPFGRAHAYTLRCTIFTDDVNIYTGSLIGKEITLSSDEVTLVQNRFVIVSNLGSMSANYAKESVTIEAVDYYISGLQYQTCTISGYQTVDSILADFFPGLVRSWYIGGWSTSTTCRKMMFNINYLYEDEGQTAPSKFDVLEAVLKFINRNIFVRLVGGTPKVYLYSYNDVSDFTTMNINGSAIAQADRSITMIDAADKYTLTSKYEDNEVKNPKVMYDTEQDYNTIVANRTTYFYYNYFGTDGCDIDFPESFDEVGDFSVSAIQAAVANGESGAVFINSQVSEGGRYDASGHEERLMMMGIDTDQDSHYTYTFYPNFFLIGGWYYTRENMTVYLQLKHSRRFCEYPLPGVANKKEYKPNKYYLLFRYDITFYFSDGTTETLERYANIEGNNSREVTITTGSDFSPWSNGRIAQKIDDSGHLIEIGQRYEGLITQVDIKVYPGLYVSNDGINHVYSTYGCKYGFDTFEANIVQTASMDSDVFDTDTVYAWKNDVDTDKAIHVNGSDTKEDAKYVSYCYKKMGSNVVLKNNGTQFETYDHVVNESDSKNYYDRNCNSEERYVADYGAQFGKCRFMEQLSLKGLLGFDKIYNDVYFGKTCRAVAIEQDIIEDVTNIKLLENESL